MLNSPTTAPESADQAKASAFARAEALHELEDASSALLSSDLDDAIEQLKRAIDSIREVEDFTGGAITTLEDALDGLQAVRDAVDDAQDAIAAAVRDLNAPDKAYENKESDKDNNDNNEDDEDDEDEDQDEDQDDEGSAS
jgi:hypothetical protein